MDRRIPGERAESDHSNTTSRTMDLDHTTPYQRGPDRPPGQTGLHNLGPLTRREHRARTFGPLRLRQPWPGIFTWRTPTGRVIITTAAGTHDIGINPYADAIWHAAGRPSATAPIG